MPIKVKKKRRKRIIVLSAILFIFVAFSAVSLMYIKHAYDAYCPRTDEPKYSYLLRYSDVSEYPVTHVTFKSGANTLAGYIYGEQNTKGLVVMAHGMGEGAEVYLAQTLYFVDHGWRVFIYDGTGSYSSEGKSTVGLAQGAIDLDAALAYAQTNPSLNSLPTVLWGHSWGGYAVAAVLKDGFPIKAAVSVSGFNSPVELTAEEGARVMGALNIIEYPYEWLYQTYLFGSRASATAVDAINSVKTPVMVVHGDTDQSISATGAAIIAHRNEIKNPNVVYILQTGENGGHKSVYMSLDAIKYKGIILDPQLYSLSSLYRGNIPDEALSKFYAAVDRKTASGIDTALFDRMNAFYEESIKK